MKILCVAHVFYPEFWPELADCIRNVDEPLDLVVTYVDESKDIPGMVRRDFPDAKTVLCENRGFDVWPFFKAISTVDAYGYDLIVKLPAIRSYSTIATIWDRVGATICWGSYAVRPTGRPQRPVSPILPSGWWRTQG